jgi:hypothetical protein
MSTYNNILFITIGDSSDINTYQSVDILSKFCYQKFKDDNQYKHDIMSIISQRKGIVNNNNDSKLIDPNIYRSDENKGYLYDSDTYKSEYIMENTAKILQLIFNENNTIDKDTNIKKGGAYGDHGDGDEVDVGDDTNKEIDENDKKEIEQYKIDIDLDRIKNDLFYITNSIDHKYKNKDDNYHISNVINDALTAKKYFITEENREIKENIDKYIIDYNIITLIDTLNNEIYEEYYNIIDNDISKKIEIYSNILLIINNYIIKIKIENDNKIKELKEKLTKYHKFYNEIIYKREISFLISDHNKYILNIKEIIKNSIFILKNDTYINNIDKLTAFYQDIQLNINDKIKNSLINEDKCLDYIYKYNEKNSIFDDYFNNIDYLYLTDNHYIKLYNKKNVIKSDLHLQDKDFELIKNNEELIKKNKNDKLIYKSYNDITELIKGEKKLIFIIINSIKTINKFNKIKIFSFVIVKYSIYILLLNLQ